MRCQARDIPSEVAPFTLPTMLLTDRIRILEDGTLEIIDPRFEDLDILRIADPSYVVTAAPLAAFEQPRIMTTRAAGAGVPMKELATERTDVLWQRHDDWLAAFRAGESWPRAAAGEATFLDLKGELARRALSRCRLCARACDVDRENGARGICGLGAELNVAEHYVHIAEETPINPSYVVSSAGCGLRCRFCQQWPLLAPEQKGERPTSLDWTGVLQSGARTLSFAGGNPDESLPGILQLLMTMPEGFPLPLVWNSHAYSTTETLSLLHGVVDVFLPDLKFGAAECGVALAGIPRYPDIAEAAIAAMAAQRVPVIVRVLVLPGHVGCCHVPSVHRLAALASKYMWVSIRGQYSPDYRIVSGSPLWRRASPAEVERVRAAARACAVPSIDDIDGQSAFSTVAAC